MTHSTAKGGIPPTQQARLGAELAAIFAAHRTPEGVSVQRKDED